MPAITHEGVGVAASTSSATGIPNVTFNLNRVSVLTSRQLLVKYTAEPKRVDKTDADDALNPSNYVLTGPGVVTVTTVVPVISNPNEVVLILSEPLGAGSWMLSASSTIQRAG